MIKKIVFSLLIFHIHILSAQSYKLKGKLLDQEQNIPLEYATIGIYAAETDILKESGITDLEGNFSIKIEKGIYDIKIEYLSYESKELTKFTIDSNVDLGAIYLKYKTNALDEVTVISETTQLEVRLDKKIYTLGKDLTVAGGTVTDALENVPSVSVDVEGGISLRGNENVRILINGKPSALAGFGNTDVLQQLPADAIEKIEVVTSPSARYDAQGTAGIINIVLKRDKTLGFNGTVRLETGSPFNNRIASNLNWRTDKFNFFGNIGYSHRKPPGNAEFDTRYPNDDINRIIENREYNRERKDFNYNIGATYFFNYNTSFTISYFGRSGEDEDLTNNTTKRFTDSDTSNTLRKELEEEDEESSQIALNFNKKFDDKGHVLDTEFQYSQNDELTTTTIDENITFPTQEFLAFEKIEEEQKQTEFLLQTDYVRPMGDAQFEAGFRINLQNNSSDFFLEEVIEGELTINELLTNTFEYDENIYAIYTQYGNKFGDLSLLLGLRYESTQLQGETTSDFDIAELEDLLGEDVQLNFNNTFDGLFPTLNINYEIADGDNITLGYNRRINRPRGWFINPFPSRSSRTRIFQGNPSLRPAFANTIDLGYLKKFNDKLTLTTSVYYQRETGAFEFVREETGQVTTDNINIIRTIPINLATNERSGFEFGILYNPTKWLRVNWNINGFRFKSQGIFNEQEFGATNNSLISRFSAKVTLPYKIQWQTNINYRGPRENAQTESKSITTFNIALSKDILKDKATISINARDLFNQRVRESFTANENFTENSRFQWRERQITATFLYRFNQNKKQNNPDKSRNNFDEGGF